MVASITSINRGDGLLPRPCPALAMLDAFPLMLRRTNGNLCVSKVAFAALLDKIAGRAVVTGLAFSLFATDARWHAGAGSGSIIATQD
jgi:hypothetical protein